jgi:transcriptional regulator with XRE-family HTH domain
MPDTTPPPEDVRVGATIRELRRAYGLTAAQLGRAIGKSEDLITAIERGERHATIANCRAIADFIKIPVAAIIIDGYDQIADQPEPAEAAR